MLHSFESTYSGFLAMLWEELEDLIDTHYDAVGARGPGVDRLRLKLADLRQRLEAALGQVEPCVASPGPAGLRAARLLAFGSELVRLLDAELGDDAFDLSCGPTMVRAQNRILDEAQRLALGN